MMSSFDHNILGLLWVFVAGTLLGCGFFYSLWFSVRKGLQSSSPIIWFVGGVLLRMGITVGVFYWISNNDIWRLTVCLIGFIVARLVITKTIGKCSVFSPAKKELSNEP